MDKSRWPQSWKDQYNCEIRKRISAKARKASMEDDMFPRIWEMPVNEETVFSMMSHLFPFNHLILRILREAIPSEPGESLLLKKKVYNKPIYPAYYSDHEKFVIVLNKYRRDQDVREVIYWLEFLDEDREPTKFWNLIIGLIFLDLYLKELNHQVLLHKAIKHLGKVDVWVDRQDSKYAVGALLAFCYYMNSEFDESLLCIKTPKPELFHRNFEALIKKIA